MGIPIIKKREKGNNCSFWRRLVTVLYCRVRQNVIFRNIYCLTFQFRCISSPLVFIPSAFPFCIICLFLNRNVLFLHRNVHSCTRLGTGECFNRLPSNKSVVHMRRNFQTNLARQNLPRIFPKSTKPWPYQAIQENRLACREARDLFCGVGAGHNSK